jgi:dTDP-4-amino-4,6-dideoxygalactose transaminase
MGKKKANLTKMFKAIPEIKKQTGEKIPLFKVFVADEAKEIVNEVFQSGFIGQGPKVEEFESLLRENLGVNYLNTINSATSGLHLAIHLIKEDFQDGDEILTTPLTCTATNFAILANNVKLKWVDVDPKTCNMDMDDLARKVSPKTKGIMLVHWGGKACDLDRIQEIANYCKNAYGFKPHIIEDCAHAWGAKYKNKLIGTHGNFCVFSFQAIKHLTTGDGGLLISPNDTYHKRAKLLRWYGLDRTSSADFRCEQNIPEWGYKFHMNDINASIGICNLPYTKDVVKLHRENGQYFQEKLKDVSGITLLENNPKCESSYWIYTMHVENRNNFIRHMKENKIEISQVHDRNDKHACLSEFRSLLPSLDKISQSMICIPCGWWVSPEEREYIVDTIKKGW